jgi:methylenetetrahydrofolate dehydrogenase (NADP+)/methenyltetrahydrofolate cyclohydrolase
MKEYVMALIDGKALAAKMQGKLAEKTAQLKEEKGIVPGLVVILVGEDPASQVYVRNKERSALGCWLQESGCPIGGIDNRRRALGPD